MKRFSLAILFILISSSFNGLAKAANVTDALTEEMKHLASDIAKIVDKNGGGSIAIGEFTGSVDVVGHAGPAVQQALSAALTEAGLNVVASKPKFEVAGRYQPFKDASETQGLLTVKLIAYLVDNQTGAFLAERPTGRLIFGAETVPALLGDNTSGPPMRDARDISKQLEDARENPQVTLDGTKVEGKSGQYAVEVIVKRGSKYIPQTVKLEKGQPFVDLKESDIYGIRLINKSSHEAAVDLRIDGINSFAFSKTDSKFWIIPPGRYLDIFGWHRDNNITTQFKVISNFPETASAKLNLKPSSSIGLITAHFSACWKDDRDRPDDEPEVQGRGTGFGSDIALQTENVTRTIGQVRDNLAVRYEK